MDWTEQEQALASAMVQALRTSTGPYVQDDPVDLRRVEVGGPCNFLLLARSAIGALLGATDQAVASGATL